MEENEKKEPSAITRTLMALLEHVGFYKGIIMLVLGLGIFLLPEFFEIFFEYNLTKGKIDGLNWLGFLVTTGGFLALFNNKDS